MRPLRSAGRLVTGDGLKGSTGCSALSADAKHAMPRDGTAACIAEGQRREASVHGSWPSWLASWHWLLSCYKAL